MLQYIHYRLQIVLVYLFHYFINLRISHDKCWKNILDDIVVSFSSVSFTVTPYYRFCVT